MADRDFVLTRVLAAPRDVVFDAWTDPERLATWWGPKGFAVRVLRLDLRPGGTFRFAMRSPDGDATWAKFVYREILRPERLVFVLSFTAGRASMTGGWTGTLNQLAATLAKA